MSRTQVYQKFPWTGGINTSIDPGMLNDNDLVMADNVVFTTNGSRIKREGLNYFDSPVPAPTHRASSGTTRSLYFTDVSLIQANPSTDNKLVVGERINVTTEDSGSSQYLAGAAAIIAIEGIAQVVDVTCLADVDGSLNNKYFYLSAGDNGVDYYVWFNVDAGGTDPALSGRTGVEVAINKDDSESTVAAAVQTAVDALDAFSASASTDTVTVTAVQEGVAKDPEDAGDTGFTLTVTTLGGHRVDYQGASSHSEAMTEATDITVSRATKVINLLDYWRLDGGMSKVQLLLAATDYFKLYRYDAAGRRREIEGQPEVFTVKCTAASELTSSGNGDYFIFTSANNERDYYAWFNVESGNDDPVVSGRIAVEVAVEATDDETAVATKLQAAIDSLSDFTATVDDDTVTISTMTAGIAADATTGTSPFTIEVVKPGATLPTQQLDQITSLVGNNRAIFCFSGIGNYPVKYRPESSDKYELLENAPDCSIMYEYQGRFWANDKTDPDRLHYSSVGNPEEWGGDGDSGAIDISTGDGDPRGITTVFAFKGILFVQKDGRTHRILGDEPESYKVEPVSRGLGSVSHLAAVPVDNDDVIFASRRGFHSIAATDAYGDTETAFLSAKIQPTFKSWSQARLSSIQGAYVPELNSVAFSISEDTNASNSVWLFNTAIKEWYRWPDISCEALSTRRDNTRTKLVFGTADGRIIQAQNGDYTDYLDTGISYRVRTGTIYPGGDPQMWKGFKKLSIIFKPQGDFSFTVKVKIDNHKTQSLLFRQEAGGAVLGEDFMLGESILGVKAVLAPYTLPIEGYGRGVELEITQTGTAEQVEIYGFIIEFEPAGLSQEVIESDFSS